MRDVLVHRDGVYRATEVCKNLFLGVQDDFGAPVYFAQIKAPKAAGKPTAQTFDALHSRDAHVVSPLHESPLAPSFLQLGGCAVESQYASEPHDLKSGQAAPIATIALQVLAVVSQYAPLTHS